MAKTLNNAVELVAKSFVDTMKEEGFETFAEMKSCYDWSSEDIKSEVRYVLNLNATGEDDCYLSDDDTEILNCVDIEEISYRKFMSMVYGVIKELMRCK